MDRSLEDLALLARRIGAHRLWVDGGVGPDVEVDGMMISMGRGVERYLLEAPHETRTRTGRVKARMHPGEGAVSLVVRTGCRNACTFCTTRIIQEAGNAAWPLDDLESFHAELEEGMANGLDTLRFVAVEPLEHPDVDALVSLARGMGYVRVEAWTSARALADPAWAARLAEAGLTAIEVPLFGSSPGVHDVVAGDPWSFAETMRGIDNALSRFRVSWHLVVTRQNLGDMGGVVRLAGSLGLGEPSSVLVPSPSSTDPALFEAFSARMGDIAREVALLGETGRMLLVRGLGTQIPPCVLESTPGIDVGLVRSLPVPVRDWVREGSLDEPGAALKLRSPCPFEAECGAARRCAGLHAIYVTVHGTAELVPVRG
jgi:hypothetical protein